MRKAGERSGETDVTSKRSRAGGYANLTISAIFQAVFQRGALRLPKGLSAAALTRNLKSARFHRVGAITFDVEESPGNQD
jgi:hypothetical protein